MLKSEKNYIQDSKMLRQFFSSTKSLWVSLRKVNRNKPKEPKKHTFTEFKKFLINISFKNIIRLFVLGPSIGIGFALFCYNVRNYYLMNVVLITFTAPQIIVTCLIIFFILLVPVAFLNKKLTVFGDGVCLKIENLTQKINPHRLFYVSLFAWLLFDSYMVTIFLLEPVKSYNLLYVIIIQFNLIQPCWTGIFNLYIKMLVEFTRVVIQKIDTKIHDEDITSQSYNINT